MQHRLLRRREAGGVHLSPLHDGGMVCTTRAKSARALRCPRWEEPMDDRIEARMTPAPLTLGPSRR